MILKLFLMKKCILLIIIIVTSYITLFAQNKVWKKDLMFRLNEDQAYYNGKLFTGIVVEWIGEGYSETNYIDGFPNGKMYNFYKNGKLNKESQVKFGKTELSFPGIYNVGLLKEYNDLGELTLSEEYFINGKIKKRINFIYKDSTNGKRKAIITKSISYISNGIYEIREYHESNGKLKEIYKVYHNGYNSGTHNWFGLYKCYHENGKIKIEGNLNNKGLHIGIWKYYHENGNIESTGLWSINRYINYKDKEWKWFYPNGNLRMKGSFKNSQNYDDEFKIGKWQEFYENGKSKSIYSYINDQLEGEYTNYEEDGKIITKEKYFDGKKIKILINNIETKFFIDTIYKWIINDRLKKIDLKSINLKKSFTKKEFSDRDILFYYNLEFDVDEDTHLFTFFTENTKDAYEIYIKDHDYYFDNYNNFYFILDKWEYNSKGDCKTKIYKVRMNVSESYISFYIEKESEYNFCAG